MNIIESDITIIGAGLTGLTITYLLREKNLTVTIIEARNRLGGRIYTKAEDKTTPLEMGATWFSNQHTELLGLLDQLNIQKFEQITSHRAFYEANATNPHQLVSLPQNGEPSYRIAGGTSHLIQALHDKIKPDQIHYNEVVSSITDEDEFVTIKTNLNQFKSRLVISTLPPHLFNSSINIQPELSNEAKHIMKNTHTWMGDSIKIGLRFESPFWRQKHLSGTLFSNAGPISELYDHSNYEDNKYALVGFLKSDYFTFSKEERLELILNQLKKYYGAEINNYIDYEELVWRNETFTSTDYKTYVFPHNNNGHKIYQKPFVREKLFIAGTETADGFSGKMEGAIRSAKHVYRQINEVI